MDGARGEKAPTIVRMVRKSRPNKQLSPEALALADASQTLA